MTRSTIELVPTAKDRRIARHAAAAIVLTVAEAAIPLPLPGLKPGGRRANLLMSSLSYFLPDRRQD